MRSLRVPEFLRTHFPGDLIPHHRVRSGLERDQVLECWATGLPWPQAEELGEILKFTPDEMSLVLLCESHMLHV